MKNREIKFRGIRQINEESCWIYGYLVSSNEIKEYLTDEEDGKYQTCYVDPNTVGQYTGFTDSGKTELYEGDFIENDGEFYEIIFDTDSGSFECINANGNISLSEFSQSKETLYKGNIHENPNMLSV